MPCSAWFRMTPACCKLGLDRPLILTAFVANLFRSARLFRPRHSVFRSARISRPRRSADRGSPGDAPPVGDWETVGRRGRAGQETPPEPVPFSLRVYMPGNDHHGLWGVTLPADQLSAYRRGRSQRARPSSQPKGMKNADRLVTCPALLHTQNLQKISLAIPVQRGTMTLVMELVRTGTQL